MPKVFIKSKGRTKGKVPARNLVSLIEERDGIQDNIKKLDERLKKINAQIDEAVQAEGVKDSKGSFLMKIFANGRDRVAKKEARKSVKLNPERAEELFRKKKLWKEVIDVKEVINEGYVEQLLHAKKLTLKELESITDTKVTYAIVVKDYKAEEEEQI